MDIIEWVHQRDSWLQRRVFRALRSASRANLPPIPIVHSLLLAERRFRNGPLRLLASKLYHEPLLRLQCREVGRGLLLYEDMPKILGRLAIRLGSRVTLSGEQVWIGAGIGAPKQLEIGDDSYIGHRTELVVGDSIRIGRHVRIANRVTLNGYDGHPLDPLARAQDEPLTSANWGPITVLDYAWIGNDATILKNVCIGRGAVVASCAVVTKDVPDLAVVAGVPARVVHMIPRPRDWQTA
jgi:acetyltransferase-like isoleucine patch superfamily enzyme